MQKQGLFINNLPEHNFDLNEVDWRGGDRENDRGKKSKLILRCGLMNDTGLFFSISENWVLRPGLNNQNSQELFLGEVYCFI